MKSFSKEKKFNSYHMHFDIRRKYDFLILSEEILQGLISIFVNVSLYFSAVFKKFEWFLEHTKVTICFLYVSFKKKSGI